MDDFEDMARGALALAGVALAEGDLAVLGIVAQAFEPGVRMLDGANLAELPLEGDLDPGRPPRPRAAAEAGA
jgi:hypothetical protein